MSLSYDYIDLGSVRLHDNVGPRNARKVTGMTGPTGVRGEAYNRPEQDGSVEPLNENMPPRLVVIEAQTWAGGTQDLVAQDFATLAAVLETTLSTPTLLKWRRLGSSIDLQGYARLASDVQPVESEDDQGAFLDYQVTLRVADPRWESQVAQSSSTSAPTSSGGFPIPLVFPIPFGAGATGGSVIVTNAGKTKSWPIITVQGPANGPVVSCSGQGKSVICDTLILGATDVLTIDMHPTVRAVTVNGVDAKGSVRWIDSSFFALRPGVAETITFTALGAGTSAASLMTVTYRNAYLA